VALRIDLKIAGDVQLRRSLIRISDRLGDLRPGLEDIADLIAEDLAKRFVSQNSPSLGRWPPLTPAYRRWKQKHYPGRRILTLTGALKKDYTQRPFGYEKFTPHTFSMGSHLPYAAAHQDGLGHMPRRPVELSDDAKRQMTKLMQRFVLMGR
jgi:phage gpG-like protein